MRFGLDMTGFAKEMATVGDRESMWSFHEFHLLCISWGLLICIHQPVKELIQN